MLQNLISLIRAHLSRPTANAHIHAVLMRESRARVLARLG